MGEAAMSEIFHPYLCTGTIIVLAMCVFILAYRLYRSTLDD